jgi:hypothetical protein
LIYCWINIVARFGGLFCAFMEQVGFPSASLYSLWPVSDRATLLTLIPREIANGNIVELGQQFSY